ncbi:MAG TPA: heme-copper oxidase subunit III [Pyrinomonadaceae bacterium]|nr:heme-copper oxidase subunit III [Pyrinomonadaceae bacterium]
MEIGTADIIEDAPEPKVRRSNSSIGTGPPDGGDGHDPGGGGDGPSNDGRVQPEPFVPSKSRIFTGFLLVVVLMTFGGLIAAYVVIATNNVAEWQPFSLPIQVWVSTVIILASSITYHLGKLSIDRNDQPTAKKWWVITTVLGAAFISSQLLSWFALVSRGLYMASNPYAGFFYIMTAVHAAHVLGGIAALGAVLLRVWYPTGNADKIARRATLAQVVGWYWHFMGGLWIVLFILLGFWK